MHLSAFLSLTLQMSNFMTILILSLHVSLCAVWTSRNFQVTTTLIIWMKDECSCSLFMVKIEKKEWKQKCQHKNFHLFIIGICIQFSFSMSIHCIYNFHCWLFFCVKKSQTLPYIKKWTQNFPRAFSHSIKLTPFQKPQLFIGNKFLSQFSICWHHLQIQKWQTN